MGKETDKRIALNIKKRIGYQALSTVLVDRVARDYQIRDALSAISRKSGILSHDTGMGKTTIASLIMKLLHNEDNRRKFIFIGRARQKSTTPREIANSTGLVVKSYSSTHLDIRRMLQRDFSSADIVFLTHEALNEPKMMDALSESIDLFDCVIADEAHLLGNYREAQSAWMFNSLCRRMEFRYALTATPMTSQISQISDIFYALDWEEFPDPNALRNKLQDNVLDVARNFPDFYQTFDRNMLGLGNTYEPDIIAVEPTEEQEGSTGKEMMDLTRGPNALPQHKATVDRLVEEIGRGKKGLLYVYHHQYREHLISYIEGREDIDFKFDCINGETKDRDYVRIMEEFRRGELDIIFTSISTHMNLDCDFIFFYEWDLNLRQVVGRAERSLTPKTIDCIFLFTNRTGEFVKFMNNVWVRANTIEEILKKDYEFIILVGLALLETGVVEEWEINWDTV